MGKLNEARFHAIWCEIDNRQQARPKSRSGLATQLFMLTLQRPIDICRARKSDFNLDLGEWRIPGVLTKSGNDYFIPLSAEAAGFVAELMKTSADSELLFPARSRSRKAHLITDSLSNAFAAVVKSLADRGELDTRDAQLYDCRRFGRTQIHHKLGYGKEVAERVINHAESSEIDDLYDGHDYEPDVRRAQVAWGVEVLAMAQGKVEDANRSEPAAPRPRRQRRRLLPWPTRQASGG